MRCIDCPDLPNGTNKRQICCRREGAMDNRFPPTPGIKDAVEKVSASLKVGDVVAMPERKLDVRPAFTGAGEPSWKAARGPKRLGK